MLRLAWSSLSVSCSEPLPRVVTALYSTLLVRQCEASRKRPARCEVCWCSSAMLHGCRPDTFSLGVCNGCQLMALLGWVPGTEKGLPDKAQPRFIHNASGRFECRWATVHVQQGSPAIMLKVLPLPPAMLSPALLRHMSNHVYKWQASASASVSHPALTQSLPRNCLTVLKAALSHWGFAIQSVCTTEGQRLGHSCMVPC